ncbi:MAG: PAS domain-containing protein [Syntrophales bacterium]|nr:PAS domain-containing protein [Syntrophales bacterium]MCK9390981.1 PAS domain-containing protein [Syntrophales bacterium]
MKKKKTVPLEQEISVSDGQRKGANVSTQPDASVETPGDISVSTPPDKSVEAPPETDTFGHEQAGFPIVGIGASAGGLAAFEAFFSAMPTDTDPGMAFVLVQHLAPDHKSILVDLVRRYTRMQVYEVEDGMAVQPNCTYIIPPNRDMAFLNGALQLLEQTSPRGMRLPIDFFFRSLAQDQRERAICIVLSGTGSDGTQGVRAIKGEGGMVMAQNPESAEYDGMPRSAIATGLTDYILPPAEMPAQIIAYVTHTFGKRTRPFSPPTARAEDLLKKICVLMRDQTGHDFSLYKQNTMVRRVERRMAVHQIDRLDGYVRYLQKNPAEGEALFRDLLIGVTSFFRDPEAFTALEEKVIPQLFAGKPAGAIIRVWSPGCSTGEEAYSLAILLQERMETLKQTFAVQVFATDIDSRAIAVARAGVYPAGIAADVSPERLARFFTHDPEVGVYRIQKGIRELLVLSEQDVIKDPPFSKLDLISCRNLLIYMGGELQKKLIPLFHYALNPGGSLLLGTSETVGEFLELFAPLDHKWKLYQRKGEAQGAHRPALGRFIPPLTADGAASAPAKAGRSEVSKVPLRVLAEQALINEYTPASVVVNERGDILYIHGRTGRYLEPAPGDAGMNITRMAREGLRQELVTTLRKAAARKETARYPGLRVKTNGDFINVNLTIRTLAAGPLDPATGSGQFGDKGRPEAPAAGLFLVSFEDAPAALPVRPGQAKGTGVGVVDPAADSDTRAAALEQELRDKEEYLQSTIEEMETSNEELTSANEELQSVNEELQSTNEELETSKEELQSVNEELGTVNSELQQNVSELSRTNNDMNNLLAGTGVGTVFVDHQMRIRRFTPTATQLINLIQADVGRPVGHIVSNLAGYDRLLTDTQAVLDTLIPKELEVQTRAGDWYLMRIRPYRTLENVIEGAVLTFFDVTEMKKAKEALREVEKVRRLAIVVQDAFDAIMVQDMEGRILAWNPAAERMYGWSEALALAMNIRDLIPEKQRAEALILVQQLARAEVLEPYRTQRLAKDGRIVEVWLTATALVSEIGDIYAIATTEREVIKDKNMVISQKIPKSPLSQGAG